MRICKTLCCAVFSVLLACGIFSTAAAQTFSRIDAYVVTPYRATWNDISVTGDTFRYNKADQGWGTIDLPFDFPYDGAVVPAGTKINIGASGAISLSGDTTTNGPMLDSADHPGMVCVFSGIVVAGTGHAVPTDTDFFEVDGTQPNRVLTVQYHFMHMPGTGSGGGGGGGSGGAGGNANMMQVKFYETTGVIEFIYQAHNSAFEMSIPGIDTVVYGSVGLNGFSTPTFLANDFAKNLIATPTSDIRWIPTTSGVQEPAASAGFEIGNCYPNPANSAILIPIAIAEPETIRIELRDASGALVANEVLGMWPAGEHTAQLDTKDLPSGSYFCTVMCGDARVTKTMVIVR